VRSRTKEEPHGSIHGWAVPYQVVWPFLARSKDPPSRIPPFLPRIAEPTIPKIIDFLGGDNELQKFIGQEQDAVFPIASDVCSVPV
jgi:hypothetical protein